MKESPVEGELDKAVAPQLLLDETKTEHNSTQVNNILPYFLFSRAAFSYQF